MKKYYPIIVLLCWFIGFPILLISISIINGIGHSGGEQVELTTIAKGVGIYFVGSLVVMMFIFIAYIKWFKENFIGATDNTKNAINPY